MADFDQIFVNAAGGGWSFAVSRDSSVWIDYYRFDTDYREARSDIVHSRVPGGSGRVSPEWSLGFEYTRGPDRLDMLTLDRTGAFEANTFSPFADFRLTPMLSLDARYDYQTRPLDLRVHRAVLPLVSRF